ncbi:MAG: hypothetical protein LBM17_03345 [Candidatus Accumulibacter sp.]|jgi:hypothetical protein|nr:hypothetical protein [Accumulibacter sp.]
MADSVQQLRRLLVAEEVFTDAMRNTRPAKSLQNTRSGLLKHLREVGQSGDLYLIVATERGIIDGDLSRYANSRAMSSSLNAALNEIAVIERHIGLVSDPDKYRTINEGYSLPKNRKGGLPFDEARQAMASHLARLDNMDKSRLDDDEKKIIDARKTAIFNAGKLYARRQAETLGVESKRDVL